MKERLSGYHIKYLKFPVVHLGKIPPRITGVKVHQSVHRDEIIVDVGVQYSGDLCIQVRQLWCKVESLQRVAIYRWPIIPKILTHLIGN